MAAGFYHPLTLGVRRVRTSRPPGDEPDQSEPGRLQYDSWREGTQRLSYEYEEHPEARILDELRRARVGGRLWLVLGEPGSGKSTLLGEWYSRWGGQLGEPYLGLTVPVLVPLRELREKDGSLADDALADHLWRVGVESRARLEDTACAMYRDSLVRAFTPVWLLDGLDELLPSLLQERLLQRLVNLPGIKVVSCRSAVYEPLRGMAGRYQEAGREYDVVGLRPADQLAFLAAALEGNSQRATELHAAIGRNTAVRLLAANPLMLSLIAQVASPGSLPGTRAAFYERAVREMWYRKIGHEPGATELAGARDAVLTTLAGRMRLDRVEGEGEWLGKAVKAAAGERSARLRDFLVQAGLLRVDSRREVFSFAHLTFQEYYLARSFRSTSLDQLLEDYWRFPQYEETLALLISQKVEDGSVPEVEGAIDSFVNRYQVAHQSEPHILWREQRSPLRTVLHILARSGFRLGTEYSGALRIRLWSWINKSSLRALAVASDPNMPADALRLLVQAPEEVVRRAAARNPSMPADALRLLAQDPDEDVRWAAAGNPGMPADALRLLAQDPDEEVRRAAAQNPGMPADALRLLAQGSEGYVRRAAAQNPGMPADALRLLAQDPEVDVRREAAQNPGTPADALRLLAQDPEVYVRMGAARNPSTPAEALLRVVQDHEQSVRMGAARNPSTPAEALLRLAQAPEEIVRRAAAQNLGMPADALRLLAQDPEVYVRGVAAQNPGILLEDL